MEVYINGVKYVPAKEVVVNAETFMKKLIEQCWGKIDDERLKRLLDEDYLRVYVSDCLEENKGESLQEFYDRLSEK